MPAKKIAAKARSAAPKPVKKPAAKVKPVKKTAIAQKLSKTGAPKSPEAVVPASVAGLSELEARFVQEYLVDLNGTQAYLRAKPGAKETTARTESSKLLAKPNIQASVTKGKAERSERTGITADIAIKEAWAIMTADPRELMEHRIGCCRFCWGKGFLYQRTQAEFDRAEAELAKVNEAAIESGKPVKDFDPLGGVGYDKRRSPNPECPECAGEGEGRTVFKDTRNISPAAASLFAGVKDTKEGLEIKLHSKDSAMDKVFRHLGLYNDKIQLTMPTVLIKDLTGRKD
ncbi:MAG: terminase small subunit [Rhodoferax sp.]|uniref:terminase small subunit n=1 Tax=Rhodoferax sp. TaxID=50421 RepID=UPI002ACE4DD4|nr:terminase small subunit [Rhodoferax sp.]MDZ7892335.1 terminase small subunit [Rhodoferax sp.]